jgi:indolepyruvate ferredoxin oxidoreductase
LVVYQNHALAAHYDALVGSIRQREEQAIPGSQALTDAVARNFYKLLAYKDEYEVARLYSDGAFLDSVRQSFAGEYRLRFHLAPPIFSRVDRGSGRPKKREFGPWMIWAMGLLAKGKVLRGTIFDPFGRSGERRAERALIRRYETLVREVLDRLTPANAEAALALLRWPEMIRGYGPVKKESLAKADAALTKLRAAFAGAAGLAVAA